jgi:DNA-binding GntR family transcriptional regulator
MATIVSSLNMPARAQLWQNVLVVLRDAILGGELAPGARLLEADLAKDLGVSRLPVRQAIARLEQENLVESSPNRGTYVVGLTVEHVQEIYALRRMLEQFAAKEAAKRMLPEHEEQLHALIRQMAERSTRGNESGLADLHLQIHCLLFEIAGSDRLRTMWEPLSAPVRALMMIHNAGEGQAQRLMSTHEQLLDAVKTRDPAQIDAAVDAHLAPGEKFILYLLEGRSKGEAATGTAQTKHRGT